MRDRDMRTALIDALDLRNPEPGTLVVNELDVLGEVRVDYFAFTTDAGGSATTATAIFGGTVVLRR